jgi:AcrR family transcriptional regulator
MAKIDLVRRAEIGRDRRARTRAQLMQAARALFAERPIEAVTIDEIVTAAEVAKGTFYVHFKDLLDLQAAVADELAQELDDLVQRLSLTDPIERVAGGCAVFIGEALRHPAWGSLVARAAWALPSVGGAARASLSEDLQRAAARGRLSKMTPELSFEIVIGILLQLLRSAGDRRLSPAQAPAAVAAILRAIGIDAEEAVAIVRRVFDLSSAAPTDPASRAD